MVFPIYTRVVNTKNNEKGILRLTDPDEIAYIRLYVESNLAAMLAVSTKGKNPTTCVIL
jgi:hypothetical protein